MAHCDDALRQIWEALQAYRDAHAGTAAADLQVATTAAGLTPWVLVCPASRDSVGDCSYVYRGADLPAVDEQAFVVAYCRAALHKGRRNVLFADGSQQRLDDDAFEAAIARDNERREEYGLSSKSA